MKIVLFVNRDFEANLAYNLLKEELLNHSVLIYYSETVGSSSDKPSDLVALEHFEKRLFYDGIAPFIKENNLSSSFEFFDESFSSFPIKKCSKIGSKDFIHEIKAFAPDLFISIRFGKIFKDEMIQIPKYGLINLHSAILPDYRGILGTLHAIKEGNKKIGCTLHTIPNSGIDTGEIIEIAQLDVNLKRSLFWHIVQLYPLGTQLIIKALKTINQGDLLHSKRQNLDEGSYFSLPTESDFNQMHNQGICSVSNEDYIAILKQHVLKGLNKVEEQQLKTFIMNCT